MKASPVTVSRRPVTAPRRGNGVPSTSGASAAPADALDRRALLQALQAVADGDFSVRLPGDWPGLEGKTADRFTHRCVATGPLWEAADVIPSGPPIGR